MFRQKFISIELLAVRKCQSTALTLVELLVVITIISLLVAVLVPTLSSAKEAARCVSCAANMRNFGLAASLYHGDNDGWLPSAGPRERDLISPEYWFMNESLMRNMNVSIRHGAGGALIGPPLERSPLMCPTHDKPTYSADDQERPYALSYIMNATWGRGDWCSIEREHRLIFHFTAPAKVLALADGNNTKAVTVGIVLYHGCPKANFDYRHGDSTNVVFLDSHVTKLESDKIPFGRNKRFGPFWSEKE